jgi:tetratricopeptide (TPR) repeat protein
MGLGGIALALVLAGILLPGWEAVAADPDALIKHGVELRKQGKDREALSEFERALAVTETPRVLAQIGLAEQALGLWVSAEKHLVRALKQPDDAWVKRNSAVLTEALSFVSSHLGTIEVWGSPAGAKVVVNGEPAGQLPSPDPVRAVAGTGTLVARAEGYEEFSRSLRVIPGHLVRENVQLVPLPGMSPRVASMPWATTSLPPTLVASGVPASDANSPTEHKGITQKWWFWTAIGVAVAGGVLAAVALSKPGGGSIGCPRNVECPP